MKEDIAYSTYDEINENYGVFCLFLCRKTISTCALYTH